MVLGYICQEHGYVSECGISDSGARTCPECEMEVTGLTGHTRGSRAPPSDDPMAQSGDIKWAVSTGYSNEIDGYVNAFDYVEAAQAAFEKFDETPVEMMPADRDYRN